MTDKIPKFVLPDKPWLDLFIQIYFDKQPFFRFSGGKNYHREILKAFLEEAGLKFKTFLDAYEVECPVPKDERYELVGAGRRDYI